MCVTPSSSSCFPGFRTDPPSARPQLLVLPHSAEKELREILVISLEHISTFSHLIGKTYLVELTEEERVARDELNQSIRADMGVLGQRYAQAGVEINYTRWTMHDYGFMVSKVSPSPAPSAALARASRRRMALPAATSRR